jgi:hypothetical protein
MKKTLTLIAATAVLALSSNTQAEAQVIKSFYKSSYKARNNGTFDKKTGLLSFGYGFPNLSGTNYNFWNNGVSGIGPIYGKYEHGIMDEVGIGGYMALATSSYKYGNNYKDKIISIGGGVLGYYHFNKFIPLKKLDVYAGAGVGFRNIGYTYDDGYNGTKLDHSRFTLFPLIKVGARYFFTNSFGVYAESGYDKMSSVNLGITFKF